MLPLFRQGSNEFQPGGAVDPLPHYVAPHEKADSGYLLNLISPKSHAYLNSSAGDQPAQRRVQGEQAVTVHPHDAAERGIADGQDVRVFNDRGQFIAQARVTDEIAPGVVMAPMGPGARTPKATPPSTRSTRSYSPTWVMPLHSPTPGSRSNRPDSTAATVFTGPWPACANFLDVRLGRRSAW